MALHIIGVGDECLGSPCSFTNDAGHFLDNVLPGILSSFRGLLGDVLGSLGSFVQDLLGLLDACDSQQLGLENCITRFLISYWTSVSCIKGDYDLLRVEPAGIGPMLRLP